MAISCPGLALTSLLAYPTSALGRCGTEPISRRPAPSPTHSFLPSRRSCRAISRSRSSCWVILFWYCFSLSRCCFSCYRESRPCVDTKTPQGTLDTHQATRCPGEPVQRLLGSLKGPPQARLPQLSPMEAHSLKLSSPWGQVCPPGQVGHYLETSLAVTLGMPLASRRWRPGMQLNILQISPTPDREPALMSSGPGWRACSHRRHGTASPSWRGIAVMAGHRHQRGV